MRKIPKPNIFPIRAYVACYSSLTDSVKKNNFKSITNFINTQSLQYDTNANNANLYTFQPHTLVQGSIVKTDMKTLYENNMVRNQRGQRIYDKLKSLAPLERCPFCGIGRVTTLDHYLPKTIFPTFSVLPYNLVASCKDCNTGKSASYAATQNTQTLHPYYDNFTTEQWLFARVLQTSPVSIEFYVNPPVAWNQIDKDRVKSHFDSYKFDTKFSAEATYILANLNYKFTQYFSNPTDIKNELEREYKIHRDLHLNSWETAMYQALYQDQWYCDGGFK